MQTLRAILWVLSILAAFAAGRIWTQERAEAQLRTLSSFREALAERDVLLRSYRMSAFLQELGPEELPAVLEALEQDNIGVTREEVRLLMLAWSRFDAPGAFGWARAWPTQWSRTLTEEALYAWGFRDAPAALQALETVEDPELRTLLHRSLVEGWLHSPDRTGASGYIAAISEPRQRGRLAFLLAGETMRDGSEALMSWAEAVPVDAPNQFKTAAFRLASGLLAREDPKQAAVWFVAHRMHPYSAGALDGIARSWAEYHHPPALFEWLEGLPAADGERAGEIREATVAGFRVWVARSPDDAEAWLSSRLPDSALDRAIADLVLTRSQTSPASALEWAARIDDETERKRSTLLAARAWRRQDPEALAAWLGQSDLADEEKQSILSARRAGPGGPGRRRDAAPLAVPAPTR